MASSKPPTATPTSHAGPMVPSTRYRSDNFGTTSPRIAKFDWKSDIVPAPDDHTAFVSQLLKYPELIGMQQSSIVRMTSGKVGWVHDRRERDCLAKQAASKSGLFIPPHGFSS